jgi:hypothetical protein
VVEPSACSKALKILPTASGAMPMPLSRTSKRSTRWLPSSLSMRAPRVTPPCPVNLIALPT